MQSLTPWLDQRVLVTVGTGGVGKTTVSAALGLEAARRGQRVLVLTIDPARRLADALGVGALDHEVREVPRELLDGAKGRLYAMMLDTKRTFDELVQRLAPSEEVLQQIYANAIYRNLTDALAGSREYSAMEKLHQLVTARTYDLIVVDTPPAEHALDFLDAPRRLTGFLDSAFLRALLYPATAMGRMGFRLFRSGSELVLRALERITGLEFLISLSEFLLAFETLVQGFSVRAHQVQELLRGPDCGFVLVAGPEPQQVRHAQAFWERLRQERIQMLGLIVNRVRGAGPSPLAGPPSEARSAREWLYTALAARDLGLDAATAVDELIALVQRRAALARRDDRMCERLVAALGIDPQAVRRIPLFAQDVHHLDALVRMAAHIFPMR